MAIPEELLHLTRMIREPLVCAKCADEVASGKAGNVSLRDHGALEVGFTGRGLQVWCRRHEVNVAHVDFAEMRPETDFRCLERRMN